MSPRRTWHPVLAGMGLTLCAGLALGCTVDIEIGSNDEVSRSIVLDVPARKRASLDLLFVVDNSSNMSSRQTRLAGGFTYLVDAMKGVTRSNSNALDVHVGVVSGDLGAGSFAPDYPSCSIAGDGGALLVPSACETVDGRFLSHRETALGTAVSNFEGELTDAFQCISALGESGCDFEQPLEAMQRALSGDVAQNSGFLRPSAVLGVVFVSDEDDCSTRSDALFNPAEPSIGGDAEWKCFSRGVRCGNDDDVFPPGYQADCVAREDSDYVRGISNYVDFVRRLKSDPNDIVLTGIIGDPDVVRVDGTPDGMLGLAPACDDASGEDTFPGVRMRHFLDSARANHPGGNATVESFASLCTPNREPGILSHAADRLRAAMGSTCLRGYVVDIDAGTPGPQVDCEVRQAFPDREERLEACDNRFQPTASSFFPCYTIEPGNDVCSHEPTRLSLRVVRSASPDPRGLDAPIDARLKVECVVDDSPIIGVE